MESQKLYVRLIQRFDIMDFYSLFLVWHSAFGKWNRNWQFNRRRFELKSSRSHKYKYKQWKQVHSVEFKQKKLVHLQVLFLLYGIHFRRSASQYLTVISSVLSIFVPFEMFACLVDIIVVNVSLKGMCTIFSVISVSFISCFDAFEMSFD